MCLQYKDKLPEGLTETFTAYKVYRRSDWIGDVKSLKSPYKSSRRGGRITHGGVYEAEMQPKFYIYEDHEKGIEGKHIALEKLGKEHVDRELDICGFHCILDKDEAEDYAYIIGRDIVVPVQVSVSDIIAYGLTFAMDDENGDMYFKTIVTKKMTILQADFDKAVSGPSSVPELLVSKR